MLCDWFVRDALFAFPFPCFLEDLSFFSCRLRAFSPVDAIFFWREDGERQFSMFSLNTFSSLNVNKSFHVITVALSCVFDFSATDCVFLDFYDEETNKFVCDCSCPTWFMQLSTRF